MTVRPTARWAVGVAAAALLLGAAGCTQDPNSVAAQAKAGDQKGYVSGDGAVETIPADKRAEPVELKGTLLDGSSWDAASTRGKVLVLNVWGSWCAPCQKEAPALVKAANRTTADAQFIGLNTRDIGTAQADAFVRNFEVPYPNLFDPDGRLLLLFGGKLPPSAIPSTLIVDAKGRVAARVLGDTTEATLVGLIDEIAAEA